MNDLYIINRDAARGPIKHNGLFDTTTISVRSTEFEGGFNISIANNSEDGLRVHYYLIRTTMEVLLGRETVVRIYVDIEQ